MKEHIKILDFLRGMAALLVVMFHFATAILPTIKPNYLSGILEYGKYGVQVFFVISGFIIPYAMLKSNYKVGRYFRFLLRRIVRINPPYYVSILMSFAIYFGAIAIVGRPINGMEWPGINFEAIFGNLTFTVPFLDTWWYNPVYWTLAIEFQFYVLIGIMLPIMTRKLEWVSFTMLLATLGVGFIDFGWFFHFSSFFILGMVLFMKKEGLMSDYLLIILSITALICCYFQRGWVELIFGLVTFLIILFNLNINFKFTNFLGKISYSLYITHWAVGIIAEIALKRVISIHDYPMGKIVMLFVYTGIAIAFAALFYKYVEKPAIHLSKKIKHAS